MSTKTKHDDSIGAEAFSVSWQADGSRYPTYHDVTASIELAINIHLRESWPLAILFHSCPQQLVLQNIHCLIGHTECIEYLHHTLMCFCTG